MPRLTDTSAHRTAWLSCAVLGSVTLVLSACGGPSSGNGRDAGSGWMTLDSGFMSVDGGADAGVDGGPSMLDGGPGDGGPTMPDGGSGDGGSACPAPPTITSLTPPLGTVSGGTNIVIFGKGFTDGFAAQGGGDPNALTSVFIGTGTPPQNGSGNVTSINIIDDTTMEIVSPPGIAGASNVVVMNPCGTATLASGYTYVSNIVVTGVSPTSGSTLGGDSLTITGDGFSSGMLVLVGGSEATDVNVSADGKQITLTTPPGTAGSADIDVIGPHAAGYLRRGFVYVAPIQIATVQPPASPLAGMGTITLTGSGFTDDSVVSLGGSTAATTFVSSTQLTAVVPPAMASGVVTVTVTSARATGSLPNGFTYYDASRDPALLAVVPSQGPLAGGISAQLIGTGLSVADGLQVAFGNHFATITGGTDNMITVTVPPAEASGLVDVQVRTTRGGAVLTKGFAYIQALTLTSINPASGPDTGMPATSATIQGTGLSASCQVFLGASQATVTGAAQDGTSLTITVPPGSTGQHDVRVVCGTPGAAGFQTATMASAFTYTAPLQLLNLDPSTGAIAGNTAVTLYGNGFVPGMQVLFGTGTAPMVQVQSANIAVVRTPPGNVGYVDVTLKNGSDSNVLPKSYGYYDPASILGGGSGGPMLGILNVTVLNSTPGVSGPVPGATISINSDQLVGVTDQRGQVTFSDPSLLKPVSITGSKTGFAASTIAHINARDVTLFMQQNQAGPPSPPQPGPGPATFKGTVCGFKVDPNTTLAHGQRLEAHVYTSFPYVYAAPPFGTMPNPVVVTSDCGAFTLQTFQYGPIALYAQFGIADNTTSPPSFTPLLMGVIRGLEANPDKTVTGENIILDMHLNETFPVTIDETQLGLGGSVTIANDVFSYLDLGGEGVIPLAEMQSTVSQFTFANHPQIEGQGLVFLNLAAELDTTTGSLSPPYSLSFRRQYGDLTSGVSIGPMMAFTKWDSPGPADVFTNTLSWEFLGGSPASVEQLSVAEPMGFSSVPIWDIVLPGSDQTVTMPMSATSSIPPGTTLEWTLITADSPRFIYNTFSFAQLSVNAWTSFTENFGSFNTSQ